jgi:class 3 adenylate cyclase
MQADKATQDWIMHRLGKVRHPRSEVSIRTAGKALQLGDGGRELSDTFGHREFQGFVGFVDICGFSGRTSGKSAKEIAGYVRPFLDGVIREFHARHCAIDKTIGDEVMFVSRDYESVLPACMSLDALRRDLGEQYPLGVGLAHGEMYLDEVAPDTFPEWTVFGETVARASRLTKVAKENAQSGFAWAIGVDPAAPGDDLDRLIPQGDRWIRTGPRVVSLSGVPTRYYMLQARHGIADPRVPPPSPIS